ncbi:MAG: PAS domain-containing protein [Paracoccaceae bacterium]
MDWFNKGDTPQENASVVDMSAHQNRQHYAPLAQIEGYWNALRGNRPMPLRSEIDPRGLKGALEYCFVLERIAPGLARLRVAGSHLGDLMGMEVRGMPISSFLTADARQEFGKTLEEVFETPATAVVTLSGETGFGRSAIQAQMILMPVRSDLGDTSRILGGFVSVGDIGRAPRRFNITKIELKPIISKDAPVQPNRPSLAADSFRSAERQTPPPAPQKTLVGADSGAEFEQALPGVPYLRVVK